MSSAIPQPRPSLDRFLLGCNYWASHAGAFMWRKWKPEVVDADLALLARHGLTTLRVFPLWPDFQPIHVLHGGFGRFREVRHGEVALAGISGSEAGLDPVMLDRFAVFLDLCSGHGISVIVGLVTGWMSGRLFVPPALAGRKILSDPFCLRYQELFVADFVSRFKNRAEIAGWDLGNECNCMGEVSREEAWVWTSLLTKTIRLADSTRPVYSGMHSLGASVRDSWNLGDHGRFVDVMTTHPYPPFTPHCQRSPLGSYRSSLHAVAESLYYSDIAGRPCLVEEVGSLGPGVAAEKRTAAYARSVIQTSLVHGLTGVLWWCAFDQDHLEEAPYDWSSVERELGLFTNDRQPKPAAVEFFQMAEQLQHGVLGELPAPLRHAVCLVTEGQDQWGVAYGAFILAKQAGLTVRFQSADQALVESPVYLLPSVAGMDPLSRRAWNELIRKVEDGATLLVTLDGGYLSGLNGIAGVELDWRTERVGESQIMVEAPDRSFAFPCARTVRRVFSSTGAEVMGRDVDGFPAFFRQRRGRGWVYLLDAPIEKMMANAPSGPFGEMPGGETFRVYQMAAPPAATGSALREVPGSLIVTEHPLDADRRDLVAVNVTDEVVVWQPALAEGWALLAVDPNTGFRDGSPMSLAPRSVLTVSVTAGTQSDPAPAQAENFEPAPRMRSREGVLAFTLLEVLVVIAIVGVLAGLLSAVVPASVAKAKSSKGLANLRQLGVAMNLHANDNNGFYPLGLDEQGNAWTAALLPYLNAQTERAAGGLFICPNGLPANRDWSYAYAANINFCPAAPDASGRASRQAVNRPSQVILLADGCQDPTVGNSAPVHFWNPWQMRNGAATWIPLDRKLEIGPDTDTPGSKGWIRYRQNTVAGKRSGPENRTGSANVVMVDGHVEAIRKGELTLGNVVTDR